MAWRYASMTSAEDARGRARRRDVADALPARAVIAADRDLVGLLERLPTSYETSTAADDLAVFQYTSGTTRELRRR